MGVCGWLLFWLPGAWTVKVVMTVLFSLRETSVTGLAALEKGFETASLDFGASAVIAPENPPPQGVH